MSTNYADKEFFSYFSDEKREEALLFIISNTHTYNKTMERNVKNAIKQTNPLLKNEMPPLAEGEAAKIYKNFADQDQYSNEIAAEMLEVMKYLKATGTDTNIKVRIPDEYNKTNGDIVLYLRKNEQTAFFDLYAFAEAYSTESKNWSEFDVVSRVEGEEVPKDDKEPASIKDFIKELKDYFGKKQNDGTGKDIDVRFNVVSDKPTTTTMECYVCFISKPATNEAVMRDGKVENTRIIIPEKVSIKFDRETNKAYICSTRIRNKKKIIELWSDTIKGCDINASGNNGNLYHIQRLYNDPNFDLLNVPPTLNLKEARIIEMRLKVPYVGILRFACEKGNDYFEKFNYAVNSGNISKRMCEVLSVKIAVRLDPSYGRSCNQTVEITTNSTNIQSKNHKVRNILTNILDAWENKWRNHNA